MKVVYNKNISTYYHSIFTIGKVYDVKKVTYVNTDFYDIIDDFGREHSIPTNFFITIKELRKIRLETFLNSI